MWIKLFLYNNNDNFIGSRNLLVLLLYLKAFEYENIYIHSKFTIFFFNSHIN